MENNREKNSRNEKYVLEALFFLLYLGLPFENIKPGILGKRTIINIFIYVFCLFQC